MGTTLDDRITFPTPTIPMTNRTYKRRIRLIRPGLQLRLILTFLGVACLALTLQFILFMSALSEAAVALPNDGLLLMERINGVLLGVFLTSFGLLLPTLFGIGLVMTHRVAGPIYRVEVFFNQLIRRERPRPIHLRENDELKQLAELINRATESLREEPSPLPEELPEPSAETGQDQEGPLPASRPASDRAESESSSTS